MKPPVHSQASIKAHPAPKQGEDGEYSPSCYDVHCARILFDSPKQSPQQRLDAVGIVELCDQVANADYYEDIAKRFGVSRGFLMKYLGEHETVYAPAREARMDKLAQDIIKISDTCRIETIVTMKPLGIETKTSDMVDRSRLQIDARKWLASKMFPKKYGDKLDLTASLNVTQLTEEQLMAKATALQVKLGILPKKEAEE